MCAYQAKYLSGVFHVTNKINKYIHMKLILFVFRLAFICNILFLVCLFIQRTHNFIHQPDINALMIILGWMAAPFINLAAFVWYVVLILNKSVVRLPKWLILINLFLLLTQFYVYLIMPI